MNNLPLRVLLIEDDEDDYVLFKDLLSEIGVWKYDLEWVATYQDALEAIARCQHDVYIVDYRLGDRNGLEFLEASMEKGCTAPIIFLTGQGDYEIDLEAMKAGASDYLVKSQINAPLLERAIRYAVERKRAEEALRESEKQLKLLSSKLLIVQEEERTSLAQELHNSIGQPLVAVKFGLENTLNQMVRGTVSPKSVEHLIPMIRQAIDEVRKIYMGLRPTILDDFGVITAINWLCRQFNAAYPEIHLERETLIGEDKVAENLKIVIFRVLQEALNNIGRYSEAGFVHIALEETGGTIALSIKDDGVGFDIKEILSSKNPRKGLGIASMKERTMISGGTFAVESSRGEGTTIRASWPSPQGL